MRLKQEAAVLVWMGSTDSTWLSRTLEQNNKSNSLSVRAEKGVVRFLKLTAERNIISVLINDYKMCKENLKQKLSERDVTLNTMTTLVK